MDAHNGGGVADEEHRGFAGVATCLEVPGLSEPGKHLSPPDSPGLLALLILAAGVLAPIRGALLADRGQPAPG